MNNNYIIDNTEDVYEFTLVDDLIVLVCEQGNWFVEIDDDSIDNDIILLESEEEEIEFLEEEINLWDKYILTKKEFEEIKTTINKYRFEEDESYGN